MVDSRRDGNFCVLGWRHSRHSSSFIGNEEGTCVVTLLVCSGYSGSRQTEAANLKNSYVICTSITLAGCTTGC